MFLQWIAKCELVPLSSDSHVLKKFSEKCQRTLCSMVVAFLNTDGVDLAEILPSGHHIRWSMEIIGHSFALNLDDAEVIAGAIRIYEKWLGVDANAKVKDQRPACMEKVEQAFIQDLLGQMTLLFEERAETARAQTDVAITKHVQLCSRVLEIFDAVAKRHGARLSPQTWDRMIRLLLGAADGILHGSRSVLGNHLCGSLVRILFELYLRSLSHCGPRGELWNLLQKFYRRWIHRLLVIEQWNSVTLALTRNVMRQLHSVESDDSSREVEIVWAENRVQSKVELEASLLAYAWYRLLRVVGHPTGFTDPEVYLSALKGVSRLADEFTKIEQIPAVQWDQVLGALNSTPGGRDADLSILDHRTKSRARAATHNSANRSRSPPDLNTILRLLGPWLFDACLSRSSRFVLCRSEALRCLGKLVCLFSTGRSKRVHWAYGVRSLMSLQAALLDEDDRIVASAVFNWSRVFGQYGNHTLRGVAVMTGSFHRAVERVFRSCERLGPEDQFLGGIPVILLRRACIEACSSLLTLHTHLPRHLIKEAEKEVVIPSMAGMPGLFSTLPKHTSSQVVALLVNSIKLETDPTNQQMMMWLLTVAIQQEAAFWSNGLASSRNSQVPVTILLMCSMVTKAGRYKAPVMFAAFECLRHLSLAADELYSHATSSVVHLVSACCEFIITSAPVLRTNRAPFFLDELMSAAYRCIGEWVVAAPLLLSKPQVMAKIISTIIDGNDRGSSLTAKGSTIPVREASQRLLGILMKHHATQVDTDAIRLDERTALVELCDRVDVDPLLHCRFFSMNKNSVLTVIEKPETRSAPSAETILILRDSSGRYVWRQKPRFRDGLRLKSLEEYERYVEAINDDDVDDEVFDAALELGDDDAPGEGNEGGKDPLLQALRTTHQSSSLMSWEVSPDKLDRSMQAIQSGEGNTGLSSTSERQASAINGSHDRDIHMAIFGDLLSVQANADKDAEAITGLSQPALPCRAPKRPVKDAALQSWEVSRRMITELGFLSVRNWGSVFAMKATSGDLLRDLLDLDSLPYREVFEVAVAYVQSHGSEGGFDNVHVVSSVDVEVGMTTVSQDYEQFLSTLGDRITLGDTKGANFAPPIEMTQRFDGDVVYHASYSGDVCFYVPTFPVKNRADGAFAEPVYLLERAHVLIVWNESQLNYRPGSVLWETTFNLPTPSSQVVLIIDPLGNDLYCVRISHEGSPLFNQRDVIAREDDNYVDEGEVHCARVLGPLQDGMVVNGAWLGPLIRQTAINAAKIARAFHRYQHNVGATTLAPPDGPEWQRERRITAIIDKYIHPQLPGEFYGGLFTDVGQYAAQEGLSADDTPMAEERDSYGSYVMDG